MTVEKKVGIKPIPKEIIAPSKDPRAVQTALLKKVTLQNETIISLLSKIHDSLQGVETIPVQQAPKPKAKSKKQYTYVPKNLRPTEIVVEEKELVPPPVPQRTPRKPRVTVKKTPPVITAKSKKAIINNDENNLGEENPFIFTK